MDLLEPMGCACVAVRLAPTLWRLVFARQVAWSFGVGAEGAPELDLGRVVRGGKEKYKKDAVRAGMSGGLEMVARKRLGVGV